MLGRIVAIVEIRVILCRTRASCSGRWLGNVHDGARQGRRVLGVVVVVVVVNKCPAPHLEIAHIWYLVIQNGIKIGWRR